MLGLILIEDSSMENIKIIDDCVSKQFQDFLFKQLNPKFLNWTFLENVAYDDANTYGVSCGLSNTPFINDQILNTSYWFLYPFLLEVCGKQNIVVKNLLKIRIGLYINSSSEKVHNAHIDREAPHMAALYYPHDCDGDTFFYTDHTAVKEILRVSPKKGRMVLFDGSIYHASSNPISSSYRTSINFNFTV